MKDTVKRMKIQSTRWEKIFAKHLSDRGLVSKIYFKGLKLNNKEITKTTKINKREKFEQTPRKEGTQMANAHMKRYSTSFVIREM